MKVGMGAYYLMEYMEETASRFVHVYPLDV